MIRTRGFAFDELQKIHEMEALKDLTKKLKNFHTLSPPLDCL